MHRNDWSSMTHLLEPSNQPGPLSASVLHNESALRKIQLGQLVQFLVRSCADEIIHEICKSARIRVQGLEHVTQAKLMARIPLAHMLQRRPLI
jgi:hypothetical protein